MIEDPNKQDESLDATARDYLGKPSPLAFKNQPALPSGGGSIGVGAGPNTTAGGTGASGVKRDATLAKMLTDMGLDPSVGGDGNSGGEAAAGVSSPAITGFDPTTANIGVNAASLALGVPGFLSLAGMLAGIPGLAAPVSGPVATAITAGKAGSSLAGKAGLAPASDLTLATPGSPGKSAVSPTYTGFFDALANAIMGRANFTVADDPTPTGVVDLGNPADNPSIYSDTNVPGVNTGFGFGQTGHPSFGFAGQNAPSQSPATFAQTPSIQGRGDTGNSGGDASGDSHICGAFRRRGLLDTPTLRANARFRRAMSAREYAGYDRWARPLVAWGEAKPWRARVLLAACGWLVRAYMQEIAQPGSSRLGRVVLHVGLKVCAWLGTPKAVTA